MGEIINSFPGYKFWLNPDTNKPENLYRGTNLGFGGYVSQKEGMYTNVALIDIQSLHPNSIVALNYFGKYTQRYKDILDARIFIKHGDFESARKLFDGKLSKYLTDKETAESLSQALKIALNSCYGLTSAKFDNAFRDPRNKNNIVALRGALFMRTLEDEVKDRGYEIIHTKTDSAKIPNATPEIIKFCMDFAAKYGYVFEHEATYDRMCLVDKANYIAKYLDADTCMTRYGYIPSKNKKKSGKWTATGAKFQHPFIFKTLFSHEPIEFEDMCETKEVKTAMYLDFNETLPDVSMYEAELLAREKAENAGKFYKKKFQDMTDDQLISEIKNGHAYKFIGKNGLFTPVVSGTHGGELMSYDGKSYSAVAGTKGYRWLESEIVKQTNMQDKIDLSYYRSLVDDAIASISKYGDFEWFANSDDPPSEINHPPADNDVPWLMPCHDPNKTICEDCPEYETCSYLKEMGNVS